ncbi:MAG: CooT family nickel-binding protein [Methanotrichaceae archaeon]|nr:CooT family nickel-binding protein [Methanotrichaceae archaeon]
MCELTVYTVKGSKREKIMEGVIRLFAHDGKVLAEGILGDSIEIIGTLEGVDISSQEANVVMN